MDAIPPDEQRPSVAARAASASDGVGSASSPAHGAPTSDAHQQPASPRGRRWLEAVLVAAAVAVVLWFLGWTVSANSGFDDWGDLDYYKLQVRGWRKGQLHLDKTPAPELLALADPYDPTQNEPFKLGDASLYRNKYYIYFGPAPAFTLMLPFTLLTGREMTGGMAVFVFCSVAFLTASGLWLALRRRFFPESASYVAPLGVLALGFGTHLLAPAQRPMFWELAIVSGIAFSLLVAAAAYRAMFGPRPTWAMAAGGLFGGLAVASRPTCLFALPVLLVPLWFAWRRQRSIRACGSRALAAFVPLAVCGSAIMLHNYARFDHPLEWGQNYQLSGAYESQLQHFSLSYFPHNLRTYLFHPLQWTTEFPYALAVGPAVPPIPGYFGTEEVSGLVASFPFFWFMFALPLAWWRRTAAEREDLVAALGGVAAYAVPVMGLVMCYFSTTMRYEADYAAALGVMALTGLLALERWLRHVGMAWRRALAVAASGCVGLTVVTGILVSFDYHGRSMQVTSPERWKSLDRGTNGIVANVGLWLDQLDGPRVVKARFQQKPVGTVETFWTSLDAQLSERIVVEHIGDHLIRFGYSRGAEAPKWGRPLRWDSVHTHTVEVQLPSLYGPLGAGWWSGARRLQEFKERTCVAVRFSGGLALDSVVERLRDGFTPGGRVGPDFSGEVRKIATRVFRDDEIPEGLAEPHAPRGGTLQMRVVFPDAMREKGEPLFAGGAHYRSSIVFVQPVPEGLRIVFENYASPRVESEPFRPNPAGHIVEIEMATFNPNAYGDEATGDVVVRLDGRELIRSRQVAYPFAWGDEQIGSNRFGTTCEAWFRGWLLDARWVRRGN